MGDMELDNDKVVEVQVRLVRAPTATGKVLSLPLSTTLDDLWGRVSKLIPGTKMWFLGARPLPEHGGGTLLAWWRQGQQLLVSDAPIMPSPCYLLARDVNTQNRAPTQAKRLAREAATAKAMGAQVVLMQPRTGAMAFRLAYNAPGAGPTHVVVLFRVAADYPFSAPKYLNIESPIAHPCQCFDNYPAAVGTTRLDPRFSVALHHWVPQQMCTELLFLLRQMLELTHDEYLASLGPSVSADERSRALHRSTHVPPAPFSLFRFMEHAGFRKDTEIAIVDQGYRQFLRFCLAQGRSGQLSVLPLELHLHIFKFILSSFGINFAA